MLRFDAQTTVFWAQHGPQLRDLFPEPPAADEVPSCAEAGVLGALCGQVGSVMATEVVKLVTGTGESCSAACSSSTRCAAGGPRSPSSRTDRHTVSLELPDEPESPPCPTSPSPPPPSWSQRLAAREAGTDEFLLIDVREPAEYAEASIPGAVLVPLGTVLDGSALDGPAARPRDRRAVPGGRPLADRRAVLQRPASTRPTSRAASSPGTQPADRALPRRASRGRARAGRAARAEVRGSTSSTGWSWRTTCAPRSTCRAGTTRRWTGTRCGPPTSRPGVTLRVVAELAAGSADEPVVDPARPPGS